MFFFAEKRKLLVWNTGRVGRIDEWPLEQNPAYGIISPENKGGKMGRDMVNLIFISVILFLSLWETAGIYLARTRGLTRNVSRLLTHSLILTFSVVALIQILFWEDALNSLFRQTVAAPVAAVLFFMFVLSFAESFSAAKARLTGLTKNISRTLTHGIICVLVGALFFRII